MSGINLKRIMKKKGIGNKALAEKASIPIGTLNKIIYGETTNPSLDTLVALAHALDCSLDDLLSDDYADPEQLSSSEQNMLDLFRQLNDEGQEKMMMYGKDLIASGRYIKNNESSVVGSKKA